MSKLGPIKRRELIARLRRFGFTGPFAGGRHEFMLKGNVSLALPNPHQSDIGPGLLARILRQAGIARADWDRL
jgi:predicted RNA binding protein YcfA (HicA-like mRNA interferase family)